MKAPRMRGGIALVTGIAIALALYVGADALIPGQLWGHDSQHHHTMLDQFRAGLAEGVVYPRWADRVNWGLGAATFYFYPPLGYYLAAATSAITGAQASGFALAAAIVAWLGAWGMFRLVRRDAGPWASAAAAVLWLVAPYPTYAYFHRFAWAEYCALAWIPFLLLAARDVANAPSRSAFVRLLLGFAGLAATHLLSALIVAPGIALYLGYEAVRRRAPKVIEATALAGLGSLALTAIFLLPVALDRGQIHLEHTQSEFFHYARHFLFHDEVAAGYGAAVAKHEVATTAIAALALLVAAAGTLAIAGRLRGQALFFFVGGVGLFYLATGASEPLWRVVPLLSMIQFPWRLLGPIMVIAVWLFGLALGAPSSGRPLTDSRIVPLLAAAAAACVGLGLAASALTEHHTPPSGLETTVALEYVPQDADYETLLAFVPIVATDPRGATVTSGDARIEPLSRSPHRRAWRIDADGEGAVVVPSVFAYPGWRAHLDGAPIDGERIPRVGLAAYRVPAGTHELVLSHESARSRRIGGWISLVGLALIPLLLRRCANGPSPTPRRLLGRRTIAAGAITAASLAIAAPLLFPFPRVEPSGLIVTVSGLSEDATIPPAVPASSVGRLARLTTVTAGEGDHPTPRRLLGDSGVVEAMRDHEHAIGAFSSVEERSLDPEVRSLFGGVRPIAFPAFPTWLAERGDRPFFAWIHLDARANGDQAALGEVDRVLKSISLRYRMESCMVVVAGVDLPPDGRPFLAVKLSGVGLDEETAPKRGAPPKMDAEGLVRGLRDAFGLESDDGAFRALVSPCPTSGQTPEPDS